MYIINYTSGGKDQLLPYMTTSHEHATAGL